MGQATRVFCALWIVGLASARATAGDELEQANQLFRKLEYTRALQLVERVLRAPASGPEELSGAYHLQGLCLAAQGKTPEAIEAFRRLLALRPDFQLPPGTSPKLRPAFFQAAGMMRDSKGIQIVHAPPAAPAQLAGLSLEVQLLADPLEMVRAVRLTYWGLSGEKVKVEAGLRKPGKLQLALDPRFSDPRAVYHLEALNEHGGVLARAGGAGFTFSLQAAAPPVRSAEPVAVAPGPRREQPVGPGPAAERPTEAPPAAVEGSLDEEAGPVWWKTWWFWTVVGVVVAGAAAGTAAGLLADDGGGDTARYQVEFR